MITGPSRFSIDIEVLANLKRRFPDAERRRAEGVPNPLILGILLQTIGMARDRPSPYGGRDDFVRTIVARGPVPREFSTGIRLSMHGEGQALALQLSGR